MLLVYLLMTDGPQDQWLQGFGSRDYGGGYDATLVAVVHRVLNKFRSLGTPPFQDINLDMLNVPTL